MQFLRIITIGRGECNHFLNLKAAIYGFSAYAPSKWALRGFAEVLQMELKPFNVLVSVSYPPDTDTPGYQIEMIDKPQITKTLSETSSICTGLPKKFNSVQQN